jgi:hyaluronoglucosaminidase
MGRTATVLLGLAILAGGSAASGPAPARKPFKVDLPASKHRYPASSPGEGNGRGFTLRGTKGWAWTWDQYLAEVPVLAEYKMNFLMSCYTSLFAETDPFVNRWWEPLPPSTLEGLGRVARACGEAGIDFCVSFHPALFTERPLRPDSREDLEALWANMAAVQDLGVRWFSLCCDDIGVEGLDAAALGEAHGLLANRLFGRLRGKDGGASLIFCPVYYWGPAEGGEARRYLEALGRALASDVLVFWTGDGVVTPTITRAAAESFIRAVAHPVVIWDNYPVNDRSGALHLGPVTGRDPDLDQIVYGYMSNPHSPQNEINRIPLLTCADYACDPGAYRPRRSIGQAIVHLADTAAGRQALKELVELYPGNLIGGSTSTSYNSVLERVAALLAEAGGREKAERFVDQVAVAAARFDRAFPERYAETKRTLAGHVARARAMIEAGGRRP